MISSKDVINELDGMKLGKITDYTIDRETGKILSVHISQGNTFFNMFHQKNEIILSWDKILKIGNDVIIVDNSNIKNIE